MVVGPLDAVHGRAVRLVICTVVCVVVVCEKTNLIGPMVDLVCPFCVRSIASVIRKACGQKEKLAVGYGVLVVVTVTESKDLPLETSITALGVPALCLGVKYGLGELKPAT